MFRNQSVYGRIGTCMYTVPPEIICTLACLNWKDRILNCLWEEWNKTLQLQNKKPGWKFTNLPQSNGWKTVLCLYWFWICHTCILKPSYILSFCVTIINDLSAGIMINWSSIYTVVIVWYWSRLHKHKKIRLLPLRKTFPISYICCLYM